MNYNKKNLKRRKIIKKFKKTIFITKTIKNDNVTIIKREYK